jgi:hypothetical protein
MANDKDSGAALWWWLRSPVDEDDYAANVDDTGAIHTAGYDTGNTFNNPYGVRPALWIRMTDEKEKRP